MGIRCPGLFSTAVTTLKATRGGQGLFGLHCHWGKARQELQQNRNLEAGGEAESEDHYCLALLPDSLSLLSHTTLDQLPRDGGTHSGQGPPTSIINQKVPHKLADEGWKIFLVEVPFSQMTPTYVNLAKTKQQQKPKQGTKEKSVKEKYIRCWWCVLSLVMTFFMDFVILNIPSHLIFMTYTFIHGKMLRI